jgi:hypothetical protein
LLPFTSLPRRASIRSAIPWISLLFPFIMMLMYLLNTNYADLSFLFTILPGEKTNAHLGTEYLAALETDNSTPYFLNLHNGEVAHTLILGMTGSGKWHRRNAHRGCALQRRPPASAGGRWRSRNYPLSGRELLDASRY